MRVSKPMPHKYTVCVNVRLFGFKGPHQGETEKFVN